MSGEKSACFEEPMSATSLDRRWTSSKNLTKIACFQTKTTVPGLGMEYVWDCHQENGGSSWCVSGVFFGPKHKGSPKHEHGNPT